MVGSIRSSSEQASGPEGRKQVPHTPGPWRAEFRKSSRGETVGALIQALDSIAGMTKSGDYTTKEFEANARLIAASPDLFEALKLAEQTLSTIEDTTHPGAALHGILRTIRAALRAASPESGGAEAGK